MISSNKTISRLQFKGAFTILMMFLPLFIISVSSNSLKIQTNDIKEERYEILDSSVPFFNGININNYILDNIKGENQQFLLNKEISPSVSDTNSKLGIILQEMIVDLKLKILNEENKIKIILMFNELIDFDRQYEIIDELKWSNNIEKKFNVIPGYLIETNFADILEKRDEFSNYDEIYKIFIDETININDFQESIQYNLDSSSFSAENWWLEAIGAENLEYNGTGVTIGILDTGISKSHIDLASKTDSTYHLNFAIDNNNVDPDDHSDENGHGTHVAGIAGGLGISSNGLYQGVAPGVQFYNLKVANTSGSIDSSDVISAVEWAIENNTVDILSMSFGFSYPEVYNPQSAALLNASEHGIVPITSAGNSGPLYFTGGSPAASVSAISIGAIDKNMNVTSFSSVGPSEYGHVMPDLLAPGEDIISTEQLYSLISNEKRYTGSYIQGSNSYSNYIPLSGTSMSCPMVSGAVALILEAYPELTPEGVRIALYKGAYPPNKEIGTETIGDNGIGAGIINVTASLNWLDSLIKPNEIVGAFPNSLPIKPYDLIKFPGDSQELNISVFSANKSARTVDISLPNIPGVEISTDKSQLTFSDHSVKFLEVKITIMQNASIGVKSGVISINDSISHELLETIEINLDVNYPIGRVYLDSFHGLNDIMPSLSTSYIQMNIYDAMKHLYDFNYKLDYKMDIWTNDYKSMADAQIITPDKISLVDIVVLQTPLLPYTEYEINTLKNYMDQGGSILILGTASQLLALDSLNNLLLTLGTDIQIEEENIFEKRDIGLGILFNESIITNLDTSSSIFEEGDRFTFWFGPKLTVGSDLSSSEIANIGDDAIVAAFDGTSSNKGNLVVWSDYHWLRNDIYSEDNTSLFYHKNILENLFGYLNTHKSDGYSIGTIINDTQTTTGNIAIDISIYDIDSKIPISTLNNGSTINATIIDPTGIRSDLTLVSNGNGVYSNKTLIGTPDYREYTLELNVTGPSGLIQRFYYMYNKGSPSEVELNIKSLDYNTIDRSSSSSNKITFQGNMPGMDTELYGTLTTSSLLSEKSSISYNYDMSSVGSDYYKTYLIAGNEPAGDLKFFAIANNSNYINFNAERGYFTIKNYDPEIDEINSYFDTDISFNDTGTEDSVYIFPASNKDPIPILLKAAESDSVTFEDSLGEFNAVILYLPATVASGIISPLFPNEFYYETFSSADLPGKYTTSVNIPSELEFNSIYGDVNISQESSSDYTYVSLLWLTVRDTDGGYDDFIIALFVTIYAKGSILDYLPIIILFIVVASVAIILYKKSSRGKTKVSSYDDGFYNESPSFDEDIKDNSFKFCIHCGNKIQNNADKCPYCGGFQY